MADQVGKKARSGYKPKRFIRKSEPSESLPGPSTVPAFPVPVRTASSKKIVLEAPSPSNRVNASTEDLHLIKLGSPQGVVSAFSCCGSPLTITEDRKNRRGLVSNLSISCSVCGKSSAITEDMKNRRGLVSNLSISCSVCGKSSAITEDRKNRRGLVSNLSISCSVCGKSSAITEDMKNRRGLVPNLSISCSVCGKSSAITEDRKNRRGLVSNLSISCSVCGKSSVITDSYCQKDLEGNSKSVLAMRAIGKGRTALETFCGLMSM